jgi:hypothetical protein
MPTKDDFDPDHRLPRFLAREPEQQSLGNAWDTAIISSASSRRASGLQRRQR